MLLTVSDFRTLGKLLRTPKAIMSDPRMVQTLWRILVI